MSMYFGRMQAEIGEQCSNTPGVRNFTTPCCYSDQDEDDTECSECGAPIKCEYEKVEIAVCTIRDETEDEDEEA